MSVLMPFYKLSLSNVVLPSSHSVKKCCAYDHNIYSEQFFVQQVSIQLPALKLLRTVAERMKALSSYIVLLANHEGTLILKVETPEATVSTHFKNLTVENSGGM
jgi:hypothetical protein